MPEPYYQDDAVQIYHGDCRDILPCLSQVELVVTDPPYGIKYHSGYYKYGNPHKNITGDNALPTDIITKCIDLSTHGTLVFCRWENLLEIPTPKSFIVWAKNNWTAGDLDHAYARSWEAIAFWPGPKHRFIHRPSDVLHFDRVPPTSLDHPTEKPVGVLRKLIGDNEGNPILDPFCGSGTTLRAAKDLGRKAIGIEIEEKYCEIAARRMAQTVMAL